MEKQSNSIKNSLSDAVLNGKNKFYSLSDYDIQKIYLNNFGESFSHLFIANDGIEYNLNKNKYRSKEFSSDTKILISGCSVTYGVGLSLDSTWPYMISKKLKMDYDNLAMPGDSVPGQVRQIFAYFKKYGNPKYLFAIFPNFTRFEFPLNEKIITLKDVKTQSNHSKENEINYFNPKYLLTATSYAPEFVEKISMRPHVANNIISEEISHFYSAQYILMLKQYCDLAGIQFVWGSWEYGISSIIHKIKNDYNTLEYNNFIDLPTDGNGWHFDPETNTDVFTKGNCFHDFQIKNKEEYHLAMDRNSGKPHFGAHRQMHYAEKFLEYVTGN